VVFVGKARPSGISQIQFVLTFCLATANLVDHRADVLAIFSDPQVGTD